MSRRACAYCGIPVRVPAATPEPVFCCTGCAIANRIPVDEKGQFPVNRALVAVLVLGFLFFNQILFAALASLAERQGKASLVELSSWISAGLGIIVCFALGLATRFSGRRSFNEKLPATIAAVGVVWALSFVPPRLAWVAVANGMLLIWNARGVWRGRGQKKSSDPV
ncbi:MAG: hypothetical protein SFV32_14040 [Opitutaceae bacterium]|nr:hypothetical protein [Opitutaceae bacterium]